MKLLPPISDPVFHQQSYSTVNKFFLRFINDERDLPFIYLLIKMSMILPPLALLLYMPFINGWLWWAIVIIFFVATFMFRTPFGLMIHCVSHRQFFKNRNKKLIYYITWFLGPFLGLTPETYFSHHIGMHHVENNMPDDDSSTMFYKRDSLKDFIKYVADFIFTGMAGLIFYLTKNNRKKLARRAFTGEMYFFAICIALCFLNWQATIVVFIFTFFVSRIIMMVGNWTQHSFIDPEHPDDFYRNSITCVNVRYNRIAWNDGYHISHHLKPTLHWTEHPNSFLANLDKYAANKAIVFDGIDFGGVFFNLMRKRYDILASHFVNINGVYKNDDEVIALLKNRTQRFTPGTIPAQHRVLNELQLLS